jgi:hypothetical protein
MNTHPGLAEGVKPHPCQSSQEVADECKCKRLELEAKVCMAEEAKNVLAQMELEDEEMLEELEEEGCLLDYHLQGQVSVLESDEENFPEIEEIEDVTDEDEGEEEVKRR